MEDVKRLNLEHKERTKASAQEAAGPKTSLQASGSAPMNMMSLKKCYWQPIQNIDTIE